MGDILDANGDISNPPRCLYTLVNGQLYFSESVEFDETRDEWVFDLDKTSIVKVMKNMKPDQTIEISIMGHKIRGTELTAPFNTKVRRIHRSMVLFVDDCPNADALTAMRNTLSKVKSLIK